MHTLLAFDPAAERSVSNTGWVIGTFDDDQPFEIVDGGVIGGGFTGFCKEIHALVSKFRDDPDVVPIVISEKYVMYNRAADPTPLLIEGVIRYIWPNVVLQPSTGKNTLVSYQEIKNYGFDNMLGHHADYRSAVQHALVYLVKAKHIPTLKKLKGN